jgi:hypothetical protein
MPWVEISPIQFGTTERTCECPSLDLCVFGTEGKLIAMSRVSLLSRCPLTYGRLLLSKGKTTWATICSWRGSTRLPFLTGTYVPRIHCNSMRSQRQLSACLRPMVYCNQPLTIEAFDLLKVIGKGSFGKVMQVRKKDTQRVYALKTIRKAHIASRPGEITHILAERTVLALVNNPFIVPLKFSFQNPDKLYLVMSFGAVILLGIWE